MRMGISRRQVLRGTAVFGAGAFAAACARSVPQAGRNLRIGYVSPVTGPAAAYGESDDYLLRRVTEAVAGGITAGGTTYQLEILARDSRSDPQVAAGVATDLIQREQVDLMLVTATPETVNPVSDACEAAQLPCLSTVVPWEAWFYGRGGTPAEPFRYTYHFFAGLGDLAAAYSSLWSDGPVETNQRVGVMWPDGADGTAVRDNLRPELERSGFRVLDPGYQPGDDDYTMQIFLLTHGGAEIFNAFPLPSDFVTFWRQARAQGFRPRIATVARTGVFPSQIEELGGLGVGLTAGFWWTPAFPYACTLTGETATQLSHHYEGWTDRQWTQSLGPHLALFEVAIDAITRASDPKDRDELAAALATTRLTTVVGPLDFTAGPVPNVATAPLVIAQWRPATGGRFRTQPVIVHNAGHRDIPLGGTLRPLD